MDNKKVLFFGPIDNPLNSGRYMIAGMEEIGYDVRGYDYRTSRGKDDELLRIAREVEPDYIFILKGEKLSPDLIEDFKAMGATTILWFTMIPIEDWMIPFAKAQDFVMTNVEDHVDFFRKRGVKNIRWLHQGFAPEFFGIEVPREATEGPWYADVAMIGTMGSPIYNKRCERALVLKKNRFDVKWWGPHLSRDFRNLKYHLRGIGRMWAGKEVYMKDFARVIRHTKIFIGEDADIPIRGKSLSNRCLAVIGCGGFYLCKRTPGIEFLFKRGRECDFFDTDEEMLEKVRYYLDNEDERKIIALRGQEKILNNYTYKHQMEKIFSWVKGNSQETI
jgi:spore maturation protein CgeB